MKIYGKRKYPFLIYMLGFFAGILYLNAFSSRYLTETGVWGKYFQSRYMEYNWKAFDYMWYVTGMRLYPAVVLAVFSRTKFRKAAAYLFLVWCGFAGGVVFTCAVLALGVKGVILCIVSMFPQYLCYIAAYAILVVWLLRYPAGYSNPVKAVGFVLLAAMGIALECFVNPVLLKAFIRTL